MRRKTVENKYFARIDLSANEWRTNYLKKKKHIQRGKKSTNQKRLSNFKDRSTKFSVQNHITLQTESTICISNSYKYTTLVQMNCDPLNHIWYRKQKEMKPIERKKTTKTKW